MNQKEYEEEYKKSLELYNLGKYDTKDLTESSDHPMHPCTFFQLSSVYGFNDLNGHTYKEYLSKWKDRYNK